MLVQSFKKNNNMKFKFNWGVGLTIAMILFMTFILSIVIRTSFLNTDLHSEDYYQKELKYQDEINAKNVSTQYQDKFYFSQTTKEIIVHFDEVKDWNTLNGTLYFYRANNAKLDRNVIFKPNDGIQLISKEFFTPGQYEVKLTWKDGDDGYQIEKSIYVN